MVIVPLQRIISALIKLGINYLDPRVRGTPTKKHFLFGGKPLHRRAGISELNPQ